MEAQAELKRRRQMEHALELGDRFGYEYKRFAVRVNRGALARYRQQQGIQLSEQQIRDAKVHGVEDDIPVTVRRLSL